MQRDVRRCGTAATVGSAVVLRAGIVHPEWDLCEAAYRTHGAVVREPAAAPLGDPAWAARVLGRHATLVRQVRRQFERLRPQRVRLRRQVDGPDVDLGVTPPACWGCSSKSCGVW